MARIFNAFSSLASAAFVVLLMFGVLTGWRSAMADPPVDPPLSQCQITCTTETNRTGKVPTAIGCSYDCDYDFYDPVMGCKNASGTPCDRTDIVNGEQRLTCSCQ